jgi:predicted nucleic acid-binding protein
MLMWLKGELRRPACAPGVIVLDTTVLVYAKGAEHPLRGLALFERVTGLGAFDAVLAAAAISAGAEALVSADNGFGDVPNLAYVSPDVAGVATLL